MVRSMSNREPLGKYRSRRMMVRNTTSARVPRRKRTPRTSQSAVTARSTTLDGVTMRNPSSTARSRRSGRARNLAIWPEFDEQRQHPR